VVAALVVSACGGGSGGSVKATTGVTAAGTTVAAATPADTTGGAAARFALRFYEISHIIPGPQASILEEGAEQAGEDLGVDVRYRSSGSDAQLEAQLIESAVTEHPAGIAISVPDPAALSTAARDVVAAGIPFYTFNSGINDYKALGAVTHVGQDELLAGASAAERLNALGATNALCASTTEDNVGLEERCEGFAKGFKGTVRTDVIGEETDHPGLEANLTALVEANPDVDAILGVTPNTTMAAVSVAQAADHKIVVGGFDLLPEIMAAISAGTLAFAVDQQLYLEGYLPIVLMYLQATNQNTAGGGRPILTGPSFVDKDNVAAISALVDQGTH
jgi:simple sugar transport system substrate-binding protein